MNEFLTDNSESQLAKLKIDGCQYNLWVCCWPVNTRKCYKCGWNPRVEQKRKAKIRERMNADVH